MNLYCRFFPFRILESFFLSTLLIAQKEDRKKISVRNRNRSMWKARGSPESRINQRLADSQTLTLTWPRLVPSWKKRVKTCLVGLPWWRSGGESACQCRGHGFEPWSGKIPHAAEQLGPWTTITEPARLEPVLRNERGRGSERPAHRNREWPPLATTRESPRTETKTQHSHK